MRAPASLTPCLLIALLAGCASAPGLVDQRNDSGGNRSSDLQKAINITPLSTFADEWQAKDAAGGDFSGAYTRLMIYSDIASSDANNSGKVEELPYKDRWLVTRALFGKEFSINLTAQVTVGVYEATIPLATIGHQSNSDGESWSRAIHHSKSNFPLFLVRNDGSASVPTIRIGVAGTKTFNSRGAAAAVQVALGVARATSASTAVVTRLSEQSTKDKARAVDDAISKLFSSGIAEDHWTDRDLRTWRVKDDRPLGAKVSFGIPTDEQSWNAQAHEVGSWTITFDFPRPSIFSDWRICGANTKLPRCAASRAEAERKVHREIDPGEVLSYPILPSTDGLGTIRSIVSHQDWYAGAQAGLSSTDAKLAREAASGLCRRIRNEITGLGLNGFDAAIVTWAVIQGMPLPSTSAFDTTPDCNKTLTTIASNRAPGRDSDENAVATRTAP